MDSRTHFSRNGQGCPGLAGCQLLHGMRITISAGSHTESLSVPSLIYSYHPNLGMGCGQR